MTIRSGFFNSINGDRKYDAPWFAQYFASFIGNGVFPNPSTGLQVVENENMSIAVRPGKGWINGYFVINDSVYTLTLDNADGVLKRIDRVVMRLNFLTRQIEIVVKKGAFASIPVAPSLQRDTEFYELGLADILINNGATVITQANITDTRLNTELCGIVHGLIDQVDTTNIFNQYQTYFNEWSAEQRQAFEEWLESLQYILDGDVAANLANRILQLENNLDDHDNDFIRHAQFAIASNTGNDYSVTIDPVPASYINGMCVVFNPNADSTDSTTINVNELGAIPILSNSGQPVKDLKSSGLYTVRYFNGNFILQGEGGDDLKNLEPGSIIFFFSPSQRGNSTTTNSRLKEVQLNVTGTIRVSFQHWQSMTYGSNVSKTLLLNDIVIGTYTERSSSRIAVTTDVAVNKGDVLAIEAISTRDGESAYVAELKLSANKMVAAQGTIGGP